MVMSSVIIPAHKIDWVFKECLDRISHQSNDDYEVIVVSDGSSRVYRYVERNYPDFGIYNTNYNKFGVVLARNLGAENAKGEQLIFMDSDVFVDYDFVETHQHEYMPDTLLIGRVVSYTEDMQKVISEDTRIKFQYDWVYDHIFDKDSGGEWWTTNCSVDKASFDEIGGFDESFIGVGGSDSDFGYRHGAKYGRIKYIRAAVMHRGLTSGQDDSNGVYNRDLMWERINGGYYG